MKQLNYVAVLVATVAAFVAAAAYYIVLGDAYAEVSAAAREAAQTGPELWLVPVELGRTLVVAVVVAWLAAATGATAWVRALLLASACGRGGEVVRQPAELGSVERADWLGMARVGRPQPVPQQREEVVRPFQRGQVGGVRPLQESRAGDPAGDPPGRVADRVEIERADQHQGGRPYVGEPVEGGRVDLALLDAGPAGRQRERPPLHVPDQLPYRRVDGAGVPPGTVHPPGQVRLDGGVQVVLRERRPLRLEEPAQVGGELGDQRAAGRGEQQGRHQLGPGQRHLDRHAGPVRGPDQVALLDAEGRQGIDLIEEYARHTGHADIIRESIDGLVGEGPPRA